jgi:hypothetical protein
MHVVEHDLPQYLPQSVRSDALAEIRFLIDVLSERYSFNRYVIDTRLKKNVDTSKKQV